MKKTFVPSFVATTQIINPMNASTIVELKEVERPFLDFNEVISKIKYLVSPTKLGFETAFSFNIFLDSSNNITSKGYRNFACSNAKYTYVLIDIFGKQIESTQTLTQAIFNTSVLANGTYLINIYNETWDFTRKKML